MKSNTYINTIIIVIVAFSLYYLLFVNFQVIKNFLDTFTQQGLISYILAYFIVGIPIFIGTYLINNTNVFVSLGLRSNILIAVAFSLFFTLPMFLGGLFFYKFNNNLDFQKLFASTLVAGFMEELYYRGFLFGQLYKNTKLGFISSVLIGALIFASGHLYQSHDPMELFGIFSITFFGAIFFAWLYVEWNFNLWIPIFTHTFMNLSWHIFSVDQTALGNINANLFRLLTILLAILFTVFYKKRNNISFTINKLNLF